VTVLYFGGGESGEWRPFLAEEGVRHVSLSYVGLSKRLKLARPWTLATHFPEDTRILLDAGGYTFNRPPREGEDPLSEEDAMELATNYMRFVEANIDRVDAVTEFDAQVLGRDWLESMRRDFYDDLGDRFIPIWHSDTGDSGLEELASRYDRVGVLRSGIGDNAIPKFSALIARYGVKLHALGMTKPEMIQAVRWDSVGSLSWIDPSLNGSTIIWVQNELKWYSKKFKDQARKRHRSYIEQQGFDVGKILDDDRKEVLRLSVWSWQQFMASLGGPPRVTPHGQSGPEQNRERAGSAVDPHGQDRGTARLLPAVPEKRSRTLLPVIGVTRSGGDEGAEDGSESLLGATPKSLMRCDTCVIRDVCPEFSQNSECAYELPVDLTSKNQLRHAFDTVLSMQFQRIARMSMIEQLQGGYADQNLSAEIDRFGRLTKLRHDAEKSGVTVTIAAQGDAGTGAISRLFGRDVGDQVTDRALPAPVTTAEVIGSYVDADVVEDGEGSNS
jgi:hypothetical protein